MSKLFVGNIPFTAADADLQEWVESQGFPVESAEIIRDRTTGIPRGFGFVLLREESKVRDAIRLLNGQSMGGRPLTVNEAAPPLNRSSKPARQR
jgi:RNA recognition motif-containing protein